MVKFFRYNAARHTEGEADRWPVAATIQYQDAARNSRKVLLRIKSYSLVTFLRLPIGNRCVDREKLSGDGLLQLVCLQQILAQEMMPQIQLLCGHVAAFPCNIFPDYLDGSLTAKSARGSFNLFQATHI